MTFDDDSCYRALVAHDARFDGVFFVGVSTTGIYCRTVCPARTPRRSSCRFYASAAAAEQAGYRPCLRCRPEIAPGSAAVDATARIAAMAVSRIEAGALSDYSLEELAGEMGVSSRHLRRAIKSEFGVTAVALTQTKRLLTAKQLLTDTELSVTEIAFASGFGSLRRFNALFKDRYRLNPTDLRKGRRITRKGDETLCFATGFRPPLDWEALLGFLQCRAIIGVETIQDGSYSRTVVVGKYRGWLRATLSPTKNSVQVEMSAGLARVCPIIARVKRLFDLAASPELIAEHLGDLAAGNPGLRVPGAFDGFEMAVRAILGQQITVRAATTLSCRFAAAFGEQIETPFPALHTIFPSPERIAAASVDQVASLGIIARRAESILALARSITEGSLRLEAGVDVQETVQRLKEMPCIGEWTAQYIAMRALAWPDAFPHTDFGVMKALDQTDAKRVLEIAEAWRPWRSYATMHLWHHA